MILARRNAATLFTLDRKLQELCLDAGVNCVFTETGVDFGEGILDDDSEEAMGDAVGASDNDSDDALSEEDA